MENILMMIRYQFNERNAVLNVCLSKSVVMGEMLEYTKVLVEKSKIFTQLVILENSRDVTYDLEIQNINILGDLVTKEVSFACSIHHAMVRTCPKGTALGVWFCKVSHLSSYSSKVFSTEVGANKWLGNRRSIINRSIYNRIDNKERKIDSDRGALTINHFELEQRDQDNISMGLGKKQRVFHCQRCCRIEAL